MAATTSLADQYTTSEKLAARARLHQNYSVAKTPWFPWVAERLGLKEHDLVLDVGCGPGWFWAANADLLPDRFELVLADISPGMVKEALDRCKPLRHWQVAAYEADASKMPFFADNSFDVVVAMHMLYHVPDQAKALAEMHRVLRPGGLLAVSTNGANNLRELYTLTTVFGSAPVEPVAAMFGFDKAEQLIKAEFGNVTHEVHPASLRITAPDDVFMALTSYPPGDGAPEEQLVAFRTAIDEAFARGNGVLDVKTETGLFLARKAGELT